MNRRLYFLAILMSLALWLGISMPAYAGDGEVKLIMDGTTYYLSTDAAAEATRSATTSATTSTKTATISAEELEEAPPGYIDDIGSLISFALQLVIILALLLVLFMFVTAGIEWITSGGDKSKTENARNKIVAAVVGTIILAASYALVQLIAYVLGFESFNDAIRNIPQID